MKMGNWRWFFFTNVEAHISLKLKRSGAQWQFFPLKNVWIILTTLQIHFQYGHCLQMSFGLLLSLKLPYQSWILFTSAIFVNCCVKPKTWNLQRKNNGSLKWYEAISRVLKATTDWFTKKSPSCGGFSQCNVDMSSCQVSYAVFAHLGNNSWGVSVW